MQVRVCVLCLFVFLAAIACSSSRRFVTPNDELASPPTASAAGQHDSGMTRADRAQRAAPAPSGNLKNITFTFEESVEIDAIYVHTAHQVVSPEVTRSDHGDRWREFEGTREVVIAVPRGTISLINFHDKNTGSWATEREGVDDGSGWHRTQKCQLRYPVTINGNATQVRTDVLVASGQEYCNIRFIAQ